MHAALRKGRFVTPPLAGVVLQQHLIIVVGTVGLAVNAVGDGKIVSAAPLAEARAETHAVDAATPEAVRLAPLGRLDLGQIILQHGRETDGGHYAVLLGIHVHARNAVDVEHRDIESVVEPPIAPLHAQDPLADGVVLILQGAVHAAVLVVEVEASEVPQKPLDRADHVALQIGLDQHGGVGVVDIPPLGVDGDALNMARLVGPRKYGSGQSRGVDRGRGGLRRGGEHGRDGGRRQDDASDHCHSF